MLDKYIDDIIRQVQDGAPYYLLDLAKNPIDKSDDLAYRNSVYEPLQMDAEDKTYH